MRGGPNFYVSLAIGATLASGNAAFATVLYTYDDLGRVASITYDDGKRVAYSYDAAGNRTVHVVDDGINQPPTAVDDLGTVTLNISNVVIVYPLPNDSDPNADLLIVQSVTAPSLGTASIGGGGSYITYTFTSPYGTAPTTDTFSYGISDGRGGTDTGTVNLDIVLGQ